jgi:hypothetical protein
MRRRALSKTGSEMFNLANNFNDNIIKKNSWTDIPLTPPSSPSNIKKRRTTTGCFNFKKINLKKLYLDFTTTDFDRKIDTNTTNMRTASKKLLTFLYKDYKCIPKYIDNAISNLVVLILSDGEKYLTKQKVKMNIHFHLKLAERASLENDHQTAILIQMALYNHNIQRLNIKKNKKDKEIYDMLNEKYGAFKDCHTKHVREFIKKYNLTDNEPDQYFDVDPDYLPSATVLHMHTGKNKAYAKAMQRFGKYPTKILALTNAFNIIKKKYYYHFFKTNEKLTKLYDSTPYEIAFCKQILDKFDPSKKPIRSLLYNLSSNVSGIENNKSLFSSRTYQQKEKRRFHGLKYCN